MQLVGTVMPFNQPSSIVNNVNYFLLLRLIDPISVQMQMKSEPTDRNLEKRRKTSESESESDGEEYMKNTLPEAM